MYLSFNKCEYIFVIMEINKQPRIAVILLGNMRSFNVTFKNMEAHLLQPYNCDLYICTYDKRFNLKYGDDTKEETITEQQIKNVYGQYLKHVTIIRQDAFIEKFTKLQNKIYKFDNELDRLYTIQKLVMTAYDIFKGECARNNKQYDYIIKMRPDIQLIGKFDLNLLLGENHIIVPANDSGGGFNDHIAYGKSKTMLKYMTYYRSFHDTDRIDNGKACDVSIIEAGLRKHLEVCGINIIRNVINYNIVRTTKPQHIVYVGGKRGQFYLKK